MKTCCSISGHRRCLAGRPPAPLRPSDNHSGVSEPAVARSGHAFSLVEVTLAISIMSVIVFALYSVFQHTQKALRANITQVDVFEAGRSTMDLVTRDLSQMSACNLAYGTNFMAYLSPYYDVLKPVVQTLPGVGIYRTNLLQECVFLSRFNRDYIATVYRVLYASNGVGTLGRFSTNIPIRNLTTNGFAYFPPSVRPTNLFWYLLSQPPTNFARVADGIIDFRVRPFDADGVPMDWAHRLLYTNRFVYTNVYLFGDYWPWQDRPLQAPGQTGYAFLSNLVPASVELQIGMIEPATLVQLKSYPAGSAMAASFLANRAGQVHVLRQRIPIRESVPMRVVYQ